MGKQMSQKDVKIAVLIAINNYLFITNDIDKETYELMRQRILKGWVYNEHLRY